MSSLPLSVRSGHVFKDTSWKGWFFICRADNDRVRGLAPEIEKNYKKIWNNDRKPPKLIILIL